MNEINSHYNIPRKNVETTLGTNKTQGQTKFYRGLARETKTGSKSGLAREASEGSQGVKITGRSIIPKIDRFKGMYKVWGLGVVVVYIYISW